MHKGRVVILSDYVGGSGAASGGAGHAAIDSFHALHRRGVDVRVIAGFGGNPGIDPALFLSLDGTDLREAGLSGGLRALYNRPARKALREALAHDDPGSTVVILHQWTRTLSPSCLQLLGGFRLMVYMHDYFWSCPNGAYYDFNREAPCSRKPLGKDCIAADCCRNGRADKLKRLARHQVLRMVRGGPSQNRLFLSLSQLAQHRIAPLLKGEQRAIIYNPLAMAAAPPVTAEQPRFDVGYFGRLEPEKGVTTLLHAIEWLGLSGLFVGGGRLEREIAAHPLVEHRGWQARSEVLAAMRSCRLVVLPSLWPETWGLVVAEAMSAGVPVLVSSRAGASELVRRFGGGRIFDPGGTGDLERALAALLQPDTPRTADVNREDLATFLSAERHVDRLIALAASVWGIDLHPSVTRSAPLDERRQDFDQPVSGSLPGET